MSILHPLRSVIPRGNVFYIIGGIWIIAGLASIPEPLFYLHATWDEFAPSNDSLNKGMIFTKGYTFQNNMV